MELGGVGLGGLTSGTTIGGNDAPGFLKTYCLDCHGPQQQKGDRRFDAFDPHSTTEDTLIDLQDILDQLTLGEMPPKKSKQPSTEERQAQIEWLTQRIQTIHTQRTSTGRQSVLRRLNRREYLNTIRDLFGINMSMFDPTTKFPRDQTVEQLDNVGDTLVTSGYLLQQYLFAADQVVEKAFAVQDSTPKTWRFTDSFRQQPELDTAHSRAFDNRYMCLYECPNSERPEGAFGPLLNFRQGVHADGIYTVRVLVEAKNRLHPYDPSIMGTDPTEPLRIGIIPGNAQLGPMHLGQPFQTVLAEAVVADGDPQWYEFKVWLDRGFSPRFIFPNGMIDIRSAYSKLINRYRELLPEHARKSSGIVENRINLFKYGKPPHLRVHEVVISGPHAEGETAPTKERLRVGEESSPEEIRLRLEEFARRAYRRPVERTR